MPFKKKKYGSASSNLRLTETTGVRPESLL